MVVHGKKYRAVRQKVGVSPIMPVEQALGIIKDSAYATFDESVDIDVNLGIDPSKGEQVVRGSVLLPHGIGKQVKVLVFAKGEHVDKAKEAGADYIGAEELIEKITGGWLDFDYAVATPDIMGKVGKLAKILGPRGLLPNKKIGTVTFNVGPIVADLKKGRTFFKNDKQGLLHFTFGKVSMDADQLYQNLEVFIKALVAAKPPVAKGQFLKKATISSTMGIGIAINPYEIVAL